MKDSYRRCGRQQEGAALFMALIFLLILTVLGVFGMNMSRLENLMAGNTQFQVRALNDAELLMDIAFDEIEAALGPPYVNFDTTGDHLYLLTEDATDPDPAVPESNDWSTFTCMSTVPPNGDASNDYCYVIEYTGELEGTDEGDCSAATGTGSKPSDCFRQIYRVTTRAETSRGAQRSVQSVYVSQELM